MREINYFKFFIMYSDDVTVDVDHLYIKRIHLVYSYYIVRIRRAQKKSILIMQDHSLLCKKIEYVKYLATLTKSRMRICYQASCVPQPQLLSRPLNWPIFLRNTHQFCYEPSNCGLHLPSPRHSFRGAITPPPFCSFYSRSWMPLLLSLLRTSFP
jgi:hypothetical protein